MLTAPQQAEERLQNQKNIWFASTRPDNRPHLVPVWFAWYAGKIYVCIDPGSVKAQNIEYQPKVVLALEEGLHPIICEGQVSAKPNPYPPAVSDIFKEKYEWDLSTEKQYVLLLEITPQKWLVW